jgi:DNA-binding transcriptional LysR family regulator
MDRLEAMSILVAVVEAGSLSGAGRRLGLPLPTVSRRLSELEAQLGAVLLMRSTRKLALTEAGAAYVDACRTILEQVEEAERAAAGEYAAPRGDLVVSAPIVFGRLHVLPVVNRLLAAYPDIVVRLILSDRNLDLIEDHIDVAVRIGALADSALMATRVGQVRRVVCGAPAFFAAHGEPRSPADLAALPGIAFELGGSAAAWSFAGVGPVPMRRRLTVNTAEAAIDAALAGVGLTRVLSYQVARAVEAGALKIVLEAYEEAPAPVHLLHAPRGRLPLKTRAFLDAAAPSLRKAIGGDAGRGF